MAVGLDPGGPLRGSTWRERSPSDALLLVLDTCEHVVGAVAAMAEEVLRAGAAAHVIATSREPLRAEGEWIYPVLPLAVPADDARDEDLLRYGAVRLFVERARAVEPHFAPDARDLAAIAAICRRLDGIPLAIELAAARTAALGVEQLVARLDDRFDLLTGGRRTALPRHQTLRATLDWSYELLPEPERVILRRLGFSAACSAWKRPVPWRRAPTSLRASRPWPFRSGREVARRDRDGSCRALPPARYDAGLRARKTRPKAARANGSRVDTRHIISSCLRLQDAIPRARTNSTVPLSPK